jgi:hypothetical protein
MTAGGRALLEVSAGTFPGPDDRNALDFHRQITHGRLYNFVLATFADPVTISQ